MSDLSDKVRMAITIVLVVLRTRVLRRKLMFATCIGVMVLTFLGVVVLEEFLDERLWFFLAYWIVTGGLVLFLLLLAFYDMLRVRAELSEGRIQSLKELESALEQIKKEKEED